MTQPGPAPCMEAAQVNISFAELGAWRIIVLGIVQGITELLPISSTAHLRIIPSLLGWPDPGSAFSAAMQLASLLAVATFLGGDVLRITGRAVTAARQGDWRDHSLQITAGILIGTLPIAVAGLLLRRTLEGCGSPLRAVAVVGWACVVMGVLLALAERYGQQDRAGAKRVWADLTIRDCIAVGLAQAFALVPGVSRSGSTLTAGLALSMERATAARFSFLLGLPAIVLAGLVELSSLRKAGLGAGGWGLLALGLAAGSASAYLALWGLVRYLKEHTTWIFVWYRIALGAFLIGASAGRFR
ncbi:MAG: undecaprenyl-diphosphatase [Cyanobacteria bacterium 13_1_40CM_2_61_4]|nr:MAG: undecaprenyl-diphosphatase [Cyanobacteria bacterium 13_1_40CM_2_61_4]